MTETPDPRARLPEQLRSLGAPDRDALAADGDRMLYWFGPETTAGGSHPRYVLFSTSEDGSCFLVADRSTGETRTRGRDIEGVAEIRDLLLAIGEHRVDLRPAIERELAALEVTNG